MFQAANLDQFAFNGIGELFRVSRLQYAPMEAAPWAKQGLGRFDDPTIGIGEAQDGYTVLYCAENPRAAFIEILQQLRPRMGGLQKLLNPLMLEVGEREEAEHSVGTAIQIWMDNSILTSANFTVSAPVFDLANPSAVQWLRAQHELSLVTMGLSDLDFSHVLSDNRELTRAISRWIWSMTNDAGEPLFSGIRYRSRFDPESICIALYQDRFLVEGDILSQPITSKTPGFAEAASTLRLTIA